MKFEKLKAGGFFLILLVLLETLELSAGQSGNRIINGPDARENAFPWLVSIISKGQGSQLCGGTLLNPRVVLSAAHCTFYESGPRIPPQMIKVTLGDHNIRRPEYGEQIVGVSEYRNHPRYNNYNKKFDYDFSLLQLDRNIVFSQTIFSACLPNPSKNYENTPVIAAGWGIDETGNIPDILQQVDLRTMSNRQCSSILLKRVTKNMICANGYYKGICHGDSGGPLMVKGQEKIVIGVSSWVIKGSPVPTNNCFGDYPSGFARVSSQLEWIKANAGRICIDQFK